MSDPANEALDLLKIARECRDAVTNLSTEQLDDWYEANIGRRISETDEIDDHSEHAALVATMMFYHRLPAGVDTPGAEEMERRLFAAVFEGEPLED